MSTIFNNLPRGTLLESASVDLPRSRAVSQWLYNKEESMNTVLWIVQVPLPRFFLEERNLNQFWV